MSRDDTHGLPDINQLRGTYMTLRNYAGGQRHPGSEALLSIGHGWDRE